MQAKTILLTGATGFLGSHLLEFFLNSGFKVVILKRSTSNQARIGKIIEQCKGYDIDRVPLDYAFNEQKIDYVIHTACHYNRNNDPISKVLESNLMFGIRVLDASIRHNVELFINTDTILDKNVNNYALSKKQFVEWLKIFSLKIKIVNLKLEHMYGPKDDHTKFVPWLISQFKEQKKQINLTAGEQLRDFIHVSDVVAAFNKVIEKKEELDMFNELEVGRGTLISMKNFVNELKNIFEEENQLKITSNLKFGAIPYRENEMMKAEVDNSALVNLGWTPEIDLVEGLRTIVK